MEKFSDDTFLARWLNGDLTENELKAFQSSKDYLIYQKIKAGMDLFIAPNEIKSSEMLAKVKEDKDKNNQSRSWMYGIAATITLVLISYFAFNFFTQVSYTSENGERRTIELPDGTDVTINATTTLSYSKWDWPERRYVKLDGEAYFDVQKGSTFKVLTDQGSVTVLGTRFNVKNSMEFLEVYCYEGRVQVITEKYNQILTPSQGFRTLSSDSLHVKTLETLPSWMNNVSSFENIPAVYVLEELSNQFGLEFKGYSPKSQRFTGSFPNDNRDLALSIVMGTLRIDYQIKENTVELQAK